MRPPRSPVKTALVLTGGGARGAYQVGVLKAVRELLPDPHKNPFPILCGASAGAINATSLAASAENFAYGVDELVKIWAGFHAHHVYQADAAGIGLTAARWLGALMAGWIVRSAPTSLLDNTPLRTLLSGHIDFDCIGRAIENQALHSISVTCSGYTSGKSVSFFQGRPDLEPWRRAQRVGAHVRLTVDHLMASSAIPFLFPAVKLHREYFGDGSMRQIAPISPAIHLGAEKILVIGAGRMNETTERREHAHYPTLAQIAGHAMSSIFLDSLTVDLERLQRVNTTMRLIPPYVREEMGITMRPIELLVISPSKRVDHLAAEHAQALPWPIRTLLHGIGAMNRSGGALTSYLLFEQPFTRALIDLGYGDAMARRTELEAFLCLS
ncbi:MAG: patatin-like phospholipase family protein [Proteobacteria bacterium]|nr:patatin-like phospholipase family protein [Pseudomonadota bacterium]HQR04569.1 patatin-like phospholipase family protein [Rhodocyclaceae bacterium]